jgi:hypothetical protein
MEGPRARFQLGQVVATAAAVEALTQADMVKMLAAHEMGDWGELCAEDKRLNEQALKSRERILSRYNLGNQGYYVITEWDRSVTTIMRVEDY